VTAATASPTFWRVFFGIVGAFMGASAMLLMGGATHLLPAVLLGAGLGVALGVLAGPSFLKLFIDTNTGKAPEPAPPKILRFGMLRGGAEGLLAGGFFGGGWGAIVGFSIGTVCGQVAAAFSWRIRRLTGAFIPALFLEALGAVAIGFSVKDLCQKQFESTVIVALCVVNLVLQLTLARMVRRTKATLAWLRMNIGESFMPDRPPCPYTHPLLQSGTCPWCQEPIRDGQVHPNLPPQEVAVRRWNIAAMLAALENEEKEVRHFAASNLLLHGPAVEDALPLLRKALEDSDDQVRFLALSGISRYGRALLPPETAIFEQESQKEPDDAALHVLFLASYASPAAMSAPARREYRRHGLWLIKHAPELTGVPSTPEFDPALDADGYHQAKELWLQHVDHNPGSVAMLENASRFFFRHDSELCAMLLRKAQALEPGNPRWSREIGRALAYGLCKKEGVSRKQMAYAAFAELEKAYDQEARELQRWWMLPQLAKVAFEAAALDKARAFAIEMLELAKGTDFFHRENGDAIFSAHLVLGRLALQEGDVAKAKEHLLQSARTKGSPVLDSGGPNMTLAKELLESGERDVVVEFLKRCTRFWKSHDQRAEQWIWAIEHGEMPDFGANLAY
jgi:hypothetical protein